MRMFRQKTALNLAGLAGLVILFGLGGMGSLAHAQQNAAGSDELEVLPLRPNFYMIAGAGANIGVQFGEDGVVLVDTGSGAASDRVLAAIKKVTDKPIRYIISTSADPDHVGGNEALSKAGKSLFVITGAAGGGGGGAALTTSLTTGGGATILAHDNVETRMDPPPATGQKPLYPRAALPTITYPGGTSSQAKGWQKYLNGEGIDVFHPSAAHTDGDSIVFFRRSDVVVAGEVFNTETFPVIDVAKGGSIQGEIDALNHIIDITIPELPLTWQEGGTLVIPGHGRICDQADVVEYRDMVTIIRDVVQSLIKKGDTLEQIKAADPTFEYRARYGSDSGPWTTDMFVEAVYRSLVGKAQEISKNQPDQSKTSKNAKKAPAIQIAKRERPQFMTHKKTFSGAVDCWCQLLLWPSCLGWQRWRKRKARPQDGAKLLPRVRPQLHPPRRPRQGRPLRLI